MKKKIICKYCGRSLPNKEFITKDGCLWCDLKYWHKKQTLALHK